MLPPHFPLDWDAHTYVMGIINMTPDSFSGDGLLNQEQRITAAIQQARQFISDGVDVLDIGGESTRPGSQLINADEEMERVVPVIQALTAEELKCSHIN